MSINVVDSAPLVLSDGTRFEDLIDDADHTISLRLFTDPEIYQWELKRLFTRAWIVLAHESEVPNPGDYVSRSIGQDPVIVSRDQDGVVHVLLNVCAHRGMQVCRAEYGHASTFRCPYHGWIYGLDGSLKGVPAEREIYGSSLDHARFGLLEARVEVFVGMVWATWDPAAPSLSDYLGDFKTFLEVEFARSDRGMEVVGPPQRWVIPANWKYPADQFACDGYHVVTLHRAMKDLGLFGPIEDLKEILMGVDVSSHDGHGLRAFRPKWLALRSGRASAHAGNGGDVAAMSVQEKLAYAIPPGMTSEMLDQPERNLSAEQLRLLTEYRPGVGQIFPTAAFINGGGMGADFRPAAHISWRTWIPRSPDKMEVMYWCMVERDAPDAYKAQMRRATIQAVTSSGLIDQDDAEAWSGTQRVIGGAMAQTRRSNYQGLLGVKRPADWPAGGLVYDGPSSDDNQWNWWMRYRQFMTGHMWDHAQ
jgi:phenylpropionate dioxygenase-like ring-hydroxylating dioxygenase large terminal subunit